MKSLLAASHDGTPFSSLLSDEFKIKHTSVVEILREEQLEQAEAIRLTKLLGSESQAVISHFFPDEKPDEPEPDLNLPTIRLSSFVGCKGLSAGHVFIVGLNDGEMPLLDTDGEIPDIECCKFIVALTRTRKSLTLLSNKWINKPDGGPGCPPSVFFQMIPSELRRDGGYLKAPEMEAFLNAA